MSDVAAAPEELTYESVHRKIYGNLTKPGLFWWVVFLVLVGGVVTWVILERYQILRGIGVTGYNNPVGWGTYLVNFVFWVGIGHAGTLISAILYLFRAQFRTAVARSAEAMTVFAVMTAGLFPLLHMGRIWVFYWLLPYPNQRFLWPNFQSPLLFDVVAVSTYFTVSLLFWFTGLIPDMAACRDSAEPGTLRKALYGLASLGWKGDADQWRHYTRAYMFFAALATPLVISVHSVVSWDFALSILAGWHSTIFPPYFVAGAIHSGFAMVIFLLIPVRKVQRLESIITIDVMEKMAKILILTGLILGYAYTYEFLVAWYTGNSFEIDAFRFRAFEYGTIPFWIMYICNAVVPMVFFIKKVRRSLFWLLVVSIFINIGMWYERYVIMITLSRDFIPYSWGTYFPSLMEFGYLFCSFCWFGMWFWLFIKFVPSVSIFEVKEHLPAPRIKEATHHG